MFSDNYAYASTVLILGCSSQSKPNQLECDENDTVFNPEKIFTCEIKNRFLDA